MKSCFKRITFAIFVVFVSMFNTSNVEGADVTSHYMQFIEATPKLGEQLTVLPTLPRVAYSGEVFGSLQVGGMRGSFNFGEFYISWKNSVVYFVSVRPNHENTINALLVTDVINQKYGFQGVGSQPTTWKLPANILHFCPIGTLQGLSINQYNQAQEMQRLMEERYGKVEN